jgi:hypothetical protein
VASRAAALRRLLRNVWGVAATSLLTDVSWQHWALFARHGIDYGLTTLPARLIAGPLWQDVGGWAGFGPAALFLFGATMASIAAALLVFWLPGAQATP